VLERLGAEAVAEIDWQNARAVCIAGDFSRHDRVAGYDIYAGNSSQATANTRLNIT
jgi:hypothetical protein